MNNLFALGMIPLISSNTMCLLSLVSEQCLIKYVVALGITSNICQKRSKTICRPPKRLSQQTASASLVCQSNTVSCQRQLSVYNGARQPVGSTNLEYNRNHISLSRCGYGGIEIGRKETFEDSKGIGLDRQATLM